MNLKVKLLLFLVSVSGASYAQLTDSLSVKDNNFYRSFQEQLWKNPLFYTNFQVNDFTFTQVDFSQRQLDFKRVQTAEKITEYNFSTQGVFNFKKNFRIFGDVSFTKSFEKELGYNFSSERTEFQNVLSPNYFFAPKKGDWENQRYNLNGGLSYQFENNILLSGKLFLDSHKSFRTVDPRPQIEIANFGGEIMGGYAYLNHRFFTSGLWSQKTETSSIIYVDDTQNAPVYTETFTRFSSGYGRVVFNDSYTNYIFRTTIKGFRAGYQYQVNRHAFAADYGYSKSMEDFYGRDANLKVYIEDALIRYKYRVIAHAANFNYWYDGAVNDYKIGLNYKQQQGDNYSVAEKGQNYRMNTDKITFNSGMIKKENGKTAYAIELGAAFSKGKYIDLLGSTHKKIDALELSTSYNKDLLIDPKNKLNFEIGLQYYIPVNEQLLIVPATTNTNFNDNVITPDHAYDVTSRLQAQVLLNYTVSLPKGKQLRIFADSKTLSALNKEYEKYYALSASPNQYLNVGIAIIY